MSNANASRQIHADHLSMQSAQLAVIAYMSGSETMRSELLSFAKSMAAQARVFGSVDSFEEQGDFINQAA
jgi:hypothetical protein